MTLGKINAEVYGLGQCALDYLGRINSYPEPDMKCEFRDLVIQGGGPVATALVALSRWGISCAFAGVVGDDPFAVQILSSLQKEKVDTSDVLIRKGEKSQFAYIAVEPETGRRTIFWRRPTGHEPIPSELNYSSIKKAKVLHTDGLFTDASLAACKAARESEVTVVVDAGTLREGMLEIARYSDFFLASETFAREFGGDGSPLDVCRRIAELGPKVVGITLGSRGCLALADGDVIKKPAYPVETVDTTGCGDVFHAGFIYGLIRKWNVEKSLDFGAWAAAMVSTKMGGRAGIPDANEWPSIKKIKSSE